MYMYEILFSKVVRCVIEIAAVFRESVSFVYAPRDITFNLLLNFELCIASVQTT